MAGPASEDQQRESRETGGDHRGKRATFDFAEDGVVTAVEHLLHLAAHAGKVLGAGEQISRGVQQILRHHVHCAFYPRVLASAFVSRLGQGLAASGPAMPDDKQVSLAHRR